MKQKIKKSKNYKKEIKIKTQKSNKNTPAFFFQRNYPP